MNLSYEAEADWTLLSTCNFRCRYCFISTAALGATIRAHAPTEKWLEGFAATGRTWLLHLTGGEPSLYPGFVDLCRGLTCRHYLSLNSNLSHPCIDAFAEAVDPERVHFINAALHYEERQRKGLVDQFLERVENLTRRRFHVLASLIITPSVVRLFPQIRKSVERAGLVLLPKTMRGDYEGKRYPEAYSEPERAFMLERLAEARRSYAQVIADMGEPATIDLFSEDRFLRTLPNYRGRKCGSGYNFVKINPKGDVIRCGSGQRLGNILRKDVCLLRGPKVCRASYCPYFCEKYTAPPFIRTPRKTGSSFPGSLSALAKRLALRCGLMSQR